MGGGSGVHFCLDADFLHLLKFRRGLRLGPGLSASLLLSCLCRLAEAARCGPSLGPQRQILG